MLFAAGMGIGLVFWGVAEPVSHYVNSPPGVAPGTPEAANIAMPPIHRWHRVGADVGGLRVVLDFWRCGPLHGNFSGCSGRGRRQGRCVYRHVCLVQCAAHGGGDVGGNPNPPNRVKVMWGVLAGGLKAMQTATIVFALPFSLVLLLMAFSVTRAIHQDWTADQRLEKALRKKVRELVK
jgi:choline-glycine betaine transporter